MALTTYNGVALPAIMYGTAWKKDATDGLVELAVNTGFNAIDTANQLKHYDEARVGEALLRLEKRGVTRNQLFLQTKYTSIGGQDHRLPYDPKADLATQVRQSIESSLQHLHTDYLDSYLLHGPQYRQGLTDEDWQVWRAIEAAHDGGKTKVIGVSNVSAGQLSELCQKGRIKPMVVQNRCYASMGWDYEVRAICRSHGVVYQGFSLLTANPGALSSLAVRNIAKRVQATAAQVIFSFAVRLGMIPLTGTTDGAHMKQDLDALSIELSAAEVELIEDIGK